MLSKTQHFVLCPFGSTCALGDRCKRALIAPAPNTVEYWFGADPRKMMSRHGKCPMFVTIVKPAIQEGL